MGNKLFHPWDEAEGNTWMKLIKSDRELVEELYELEHPLRNASFELLYSDYIYWLGCKKKQHKTLAAYRRELEGGIDDKIQQKQPDDEKDDKKPEKSTFKKTSHLLMKSADECKEQETDVIHDPFFRFGLGILNYMKLQQKLMRFLGFMSIVSILQMTIFYGDLTEQDISSIDKSLGPWEYLSSRFSMGSYYQAYPKCHSVPLNLDKYELGCKGTLLIQEIVDVNVFNHTSDLCAGSADIVEKSLNSTYLETFKEDLSEAETCSSFQKDKFLTKLKENCIGKTSCSQASFTETFIPNGKCQEFNLVIQAKCGNKAEVIEKRNWSGLICTILGVLGNLLFIVGITFEVDRQAKIRSLKYANYTVSSKNFSCELEFDDDLFDNLCYNEEEKDEDKKWYQYKEGFKPEEFEYDDKHWTIANVKPGHAAMDEIQRVLEKELTKFYGLENVGSKEEWQKTQGYERFKQAVKKFNKKQREKIEDEIIENETKDDDNKQFKVVFCNFAFLNNELLQALKDRSVAIKEYKTTQDDLDQSKKTNKKVEKVKAILNQNVKITENFLRYDASAAPEGEPKEEGQENAEPNAEQNEGGKPSESDGEESEGDPYELMNRYQEFEARSKIMTPKTAFVTFRNPFASFLAKKMMKFKNEKDGDKPKLFGKDLKFSSLGYPSDTQYMNYGFTSFERYLNYIMGAFIFFIGTQIFFYIIFVLYQMVQNNRMFFLKTKECNLLYSEYSGNNDTWAQNAQSQFDIIDQSDYKLTWQLIAYDMDTLNQLRGEFQCYCNQVDIAKLPLSSPLKQPCQEYLDLKFWFIFVGIGAAGLISAVNAVQNKLARILISMMRFKTLTEEKTMVFMVSFFLTSITSIFYLLLLGAKLDFMPVIGNYFSKGKNRDFTHDWFFDLGSIFINRMVILTIFPIQETIKAPVMRKVNQLKFRLKPFSSDSKSMWEYYKLKLQSDFLHELDYTKLGNVLLMAFMFGPGIPIMFPMAFLYVFFNEFCMRSQLAYQHRAPFKFSNRINDSFIKFCCVLPILYSGIGLWMYSNRQIFENNVLPKAEVHGFQNHGHTVVYTLTTFTPGTPLLILFVVAVINFSIRVCGVRYHKLLPSVSTLNEKIQNLREPDVDNFYQYINKDYQKKLFVKYQEYLNSVLGTYTISEKMYKAFLKELDKSEEEDGQQLFASRLLYDMMIDHNNAMLFEFNYSLIQDMNNDIVMQMMGDKVKEELISKSSSFKSKDAGASEELKLFIQGEHTKTLFLINYAFVADIIRNKDMSWINQVTLIRGGKLVGSSKLATAVDSRSRQGFIFDLQDLVV